MKENCFDANKISTDCIIKNKSSFGLVEAHTQALPAKHYLLWENRSAEVLIKKLLIRLGRKAVVHKHTLAHTLEHSHTHTHTQSIILYHFHYKWSHQEPK